MICATTSIITGRLASNGNIVYNDVSVRSYFMILSFMLNFESWTYTSYLVLTSTGMIRLRRTGIYKLEIMLESSNSLASRGRVYNLVNGNRNVKKRRNRKSEMIKRVVVASW
jgi:hypothetical protein